MESLFNDPNPPEARLQTSADFAASITAESKDIGVSLEYVLSPEALPIEGCKWHVLRVSYGRTDYVMGKMEGDKSIFPYIPEKVSYHYKNGKKHWKRTPYIPGLVFVYGSKDDIDKYTKRAPESDQCILFLDFAFDHTNKTELGRDKEMVIPFRLMNNFIRAVEAKVPDSYTVSDEEIHLRDGGLVRVTSGRFKGVEGRVARIHGQSRVVVQIKGLLNFATAYIPAFQLEPIEDDSEYYKPLPVRPKKKPKPIPFMYRNR